MMRGDEMIELLPSSCLSVLLLLMPGTSCHQISLLTISYSGKMFDGMQEKTMVLELKKAVVLVEILISACSEDQSHCCSLPFVLLWSDGVTLSLVTSATDTLCHMCEGLP